MVQMLTCLVNSRPRPLLAPVTTYTLGLDMLMLLLITTYP